MTSELVAILILMLGGGAIAYLGDTIGSYMGKRRLTLFKVRPKNTARAFTIVAGALIAAATFVILLVADRGFRVAVRQGAQIELRNRQLSHANAGLKRQADAAQAQAQEARSAALAAEARRQSSEKRLAQVNTQLSSAQASFAEATRKLASVGTQLTATAAQLRSEQAQVTQAKAKSVVLEAQNARAQKTLRETERVLGPTFIAKRQSTLVYRNGAEVGRTVVKASLAADVIRQQINLFLTQLSAQALERGAIRGSNGRGVQVATVAILTEPSAAAQRARASRPARGNRDRASQNFTYAGESDSIGALSDQIYAYGQSEPSGSVALIANAFGNGFAGEQVIVTLSPYVNRLAIPKGTVLAQVPVDLSEGQEAERIMAALQRVLVTKVRPEAIKAGVIPVVDPQVHSVQIGDVSVSELYRVVDEVRRAKAPAVVTIGAAADTYSADQLHLTFEVRVAGGAAAAGTTGA